MKKGWMALLIFVSFLAGTMGMIPAKAEDAGNENIQIEVNTGSTWRFGGGDWVDIRVGDTRFGVLYGNETNENAIIIFAEYKRYLCGAEIYDNQDNFLRSKGIPIWTVFAQRLDLLAEFRDRDNNSLLNFRRLEDSSILTMDIPVKTLNLNQSWTLSDLDIQEGNETANVTFALSAANLLYSRVWDPMRLLPRPGKESDGVLDLLKITFHIKVSVKPFHIENVPWYKVNVDNGNEYMVTHTEFLEYRNYSGRSINVGVKYDHYIEGWDFSYEDSKLALGTHAIAGNFVPKPITRWIRMQFFSLRAGDGDRFELKEDAIQPSEPIPLRKDRIYFDDNWYRIGRLAWTSNVTVDDVEKNMTFQIHGGGPIAWMHGLNLFRGFFVFGAFVYPQGNVIFHDPDFSSTVLVYSIPTIVNMTPIRILAAQAIVAVTATVGAGAIALTRKKRT